MRLKTQHSVGGRTPSKCFRIGLPQDREGVVQLFALVLERADEQSAHGKVFELPFGALLNLSMRNKPSLQHLERFCESRQPCEDWPESVRLAASLPADSIPAGMFFDLLRSALDSAKAFDIDGGHLCRVLAAVGQTLQARDHRFRYLNRVVAQKYRDSARHRIAPPAAKRDPPVLGQVTVSLDVPWEVQFRRTSEEGGSVRLEGVKLWHASYIGPQIAEKSENQDATFAITPPGVSSTSCLIFALADGVSTSMGSGVAATSIVRRFCELVLQQMKSGEAVTGDDLREAAKRTQDSLDELAKALLERSKGYVFDAVRGDSLHGGTAIRILDNTLNPRVSSIPPALTATLIGGIVQTVGSEGRYKIDLLRIGDGTVEHVGRDGQVCSIVATDPEVMAIKEAIGPGPRARELFAGGEASVATHSVTLQSGETLIVSSDGLARGHRQSIASKLSELLGGEFWKTAQADHADAALEILHWACRSADELFQTDPQQSLFADNVSLIMIRCGD